MDEPKPMTELTRIRQERNLSQQRLADASGVNKATINQIERGRRSPNVETLEKLAAALGAEVADFFPKAQAPLPLDVSPAQRGGSQKLPSAAAVYTAYEALGHVYASFWRQDLDEWNKTFPLGETKIGDTDKVWGMLAWVTTMGDTQGGYLTIARESGFLDRPGLQAALAAMEEARSAGVGKLGRILGRMKTDIDFHRIIKSDELLKELQLHDQEQ